MTPSKWLRVTRSAPCQICRKPDWCTVSGDGLTACCMRVESSRPMHNGGFAHSLGQPIPTPILRRMESPQDRPQIDPPTLLSGWLRDTLPGDVDAHAEALGVKPSALWALGIRWAAPYRAWAYPMQDGQGNAVGIRLRAVDGRKWAVKGSRSGIFVPNQTPQDIAMVCEGPTDTAAALSLGFFAIGRPSCSQGALEASGACVRLGVRRLYIASDDDGPGLKGAEDFATRVGLPFKIWVPPCKDIREFLNAGGTRQMIETAVNNKLWRGCNGR